MEIKPLIVGKQVVIVRQYKDIGLPTNYQSRGRQSQTRCRRAKLKPIIGSFTNIMELKWQQDRADSSCLLAI
jgi:hypothetical protein